MEKLLKILQEELKIKKGASGMYDIQKNVFIEKVWNGVYNEYLNGSITGTVSCGIAQMQYDADTLLFTRHGYGEYNISIGRPKNNNIIIDLNKVKSVNMSISDNNWIDIHLLNSSDNNDYESGYVSIVIRG